jgi:hypothetical protein
MKTARFVQFTLAGAVVAALYAAPAQATPRTWVSGTGDDTWPCSRTAPCKTFAGAISKTDVGGEISVMDAGAYGDVTITKAITINGEGTLASDFSSAANGAITVAAGASDQVILRNLSLNGGGGAHSGIYITSGNVTVDKCFIYNFTTGGFFGGIGINIAASGTVYVQVRDTSITNSTSGVIAQTSSGVAVVALDNVRINVAPLYGVAALSNGAIFEVRNSYVQNAGYGIIATTSGSSIKVEHSQVTNTSYAITANASGATVTVGDVAMYNNTNGLTLAAGATIATANNNRSYDNGPSASPNANITGF